MIKSLGGALLGLAAFGAASLVPGVASAGDFWAHSEPHTIASLSSPAKYKVCNLPHSNHNDEFSDMLVDADGRQVTIGQGKCTTVEGAVITAAAALPTGVVRGQYTAE